MSPVDLPPDAEILAMRAAHARGATVVALAALFRLDTSLASALICGRRRGDLPGAVPIRPGGNRDGCPKLSRAQVERARALFRRGATIRELARGLPVGEGAVSDAIHGITWARVPGAVPSRDAKKLGPATVARLRAEYAAGGDLAALAREAGVAPKTARDAITGRSFARLPGAVPLRPRSFPPPLPEAAPPPRPPGPGRPAPPPRRPCPPLPMLREWLRWDARR
jgi:hypothetical protein